MGVLALLAIGWRGSDVGVYPLRAGSTDQKSATNRARADLEYCPPGWQIHC